MRQRVSRTSLVGLAHALALTRAVAASDNATVEGGGNQELPSRTVREIEQDRRTAPKEAPTEQKKEPGAKEEEASSGRVIVPLLIYTPETHVALGGLIVQFFRVGDAPPDSRVSSVAVDALVTTRRQAIFEVMPDLWWDNESNHVFGKIDYQLFPDNFWGIGPYAAHEEQYDRDRLRMRVDVQRRIYSRFYAGAHTEFTWYDATYSDPNGNFALTNVPGEDGGFTSGFGPTLTWDSRDNTVSSRSGTLLSAMWVGYPPVISRYPFWRLPTEARQFFPVGTESALAIRYYGEFQAGNVPYYHLAALGGDELLRGYYLGRYRDKHLVVLETEYRFPLFWRFGAVVFAGAGEVADRFQDLASVPIRWAVGGGLRLSVNTKERLNLRLDCGVGPSDPASSSSWPTIGVYFTAREAF